MAVKYTLDYQFFAFERTHNICVVFESRGFYDVPRVLIADARSFQAFAAMLASISCLYQSDARTGEFRLSQAALS